MFKNGGICSRLLPRDQQGRRWKKWSLQPHLHYWTKYEETTFNIFPLTRCRERELLGGAPSFSSKSPDEWNGEERSISQSNLIICDQPLERSLLYSICIGFRQYWNIYLWDLANIGIVELDALRHCSKLHSGGPSCVPAWFGLSHL